MVQYFLFQAGDLQCALPLTSVQSVIQMMEVTPSDGTHHGLAGAVNLHGQIVPVYSMRRLLGSPDREPRLSDMLLIARAREENIALWIDETKGVEELGIPESPADEAAAVHDIRRDVRITDAGLVILSDLPAFLARAPDPDLLAALSRVRNTGDTRPGMEPGQESGQVRAILAERAAKSLHPEPGTTSTEMTEVLRFQLAYQEYAVEMNFVREVILTGEITPVPGTPDFISGICAARGQIISLVDLRALFRIPEKGLTDLNRVIVMTDGRITFGVLADTISGVSTIPLQQIAAPQAEDLPGGRRYLKGVLDRNLFILDAAAILGDPGIIIDDA
jgi:chemotaxis signal transduction protein